MPEEMTLTEFLDHFGHPWLDRTTLSHLLKAFGIDPSGKRIRSGGGRPATLYPVNKVMTMMIVVKDFRDNNDRV